MSSATRIIAWENPCLTMRNTDTNYSSVFLKSGALPSINSQMESQEITKSENTLVKKVWGFSELRLHQPSSSPTPRNL